MNLFGQHLPQTKPPAAFLMDRPVYFADLLTMLTTASHTVSRSTLYRWIDTGYLPKPRKIGRLNFWPAYEIYEWSKIVGLALQWPDADQAVHVTAHRIQH